MNAYMPLFLLVLAVPLAMLMDLAQRILG